jgi:hypothetical protein
MAHLSGHRGSRKELSMFKTNEGTIDRVLRVVAGLVLLSLFFVYPDSSWRYWTLIGIVPIATGLMGWCPLYTVFGLSTCPVKRA